MVKAIDVYRKEILAIKKLLSEYKVLKLRHIYKYFDNKDAEIIKKIIKYLVRNGQAYVDMENSYISITKDNYLKEKDKKVLAAFDVMLLFIKDLTYQTKYDFPFQICFLVGEQEYQVVYIEPGDETHISTVLKETINDDVKYLIVVENLEQIEKLAVENVYRYCTVDEIGKVNCYVIEEGEEHDKKDASEKIDRM